MDKKVLIICPFVSPNQGGVESHIQKLLAFIARKHHSSIVITYQPLTTPISALVYEKQTYYEIYRMSWFGHGWFPKIEHNAILTFLYLVPGLFLKSLQVGVRRRQEYDVIHVHGMAAGVCGVFLKWILGKRLVLSTHAIYNLKDRQLLSRFLFLLFINCDTVLAVGEPSREEIVALGISADRVEVHPNWVETSFFKPEKSNHTQLTLLWVGRGLEKKGLFLVGELARAHPEWKMVARVGDGPDRERFIQEFSDVKNLDIRITLPVDFDEKMNILAQEYRDCDIFLMPSLYSEGFAAVVLEAAASGLAIVSSNLGCLPSMLTGSGALLGEPNFDFFEKEILLLMSQPELLRDLKTRMRKFALAHFGDSNAEVIWKSYAL